MKRSWRLITVTVVGLVATVLCWAVLAWIALIVLSMSFEPRGHPALPGAPDWLYVLVFLVLAPLAAIAVGVFCASRTRRAITKPR